MSIQVTWEWVAGERCCCGNPECHSARLDRWVWVARSGEYPDIWALSDTAERSKEMVQRLVRWHEAGHVPTASEVRGLDNLGMSEQPVERPTDAQLVEWLYAAEFDHGAVDADHDFDANPLPRDTFPKYYDDDYDPTLAVLFKELLELRKSVTVAHPVTQTRRWVVGVQRPGVGGAVSVEAVDQEEARRKALDKVRADWPDGATKVWKTTEVTREWEEVKNA